MPETTQPQRDELDLVVAQAVLVLAAVVFAGPALVIGAPLAVAIDRGGWRRWPTLLGGALLVSIAVAVGAWDTYLATWAHISTCSASSPSPSPPASPSGRSSRSAPTIATSTRPPATTGR
jgi:hypothetical protein